MGQKQIKNYRKALRKTAREEKNNIVSDYITRNWEQVLVSSVAMIRRFDFKTRFQIAMTIIFKPDRKNKAEKPKAQEKPKRNVGGTDGSQFNHGIKPPTDTPRPNVTPPPQKPAKSGAA